MGLALSSVGVAINHDRKQNLKMKIIVLVSGVLCLAGFIGIIFINESLWYLAPMGYLIKMIKVKKEKRNEIDK
ncbi:MAG: hypothetical protein PWP24_1893 [Clostridiales bacterium]|nr:hypothetical protein [Clostridiales bacterium]